MNLMQHPELLDRLASSYALGTLRAGARRRFETLAREQAPVRAAALIWQSRLAGLTELQTQVAPAPAVWTRIDNLVQGDKLHAAMLVNRSLPPTPAIGPFAWLRSLTLWRSLSAASAVAACAAVVVGVGMRQELGVEVARLKAQLQASPSIEYVAVLADAQAAASMLVTFDPKAQKLTLQRVGAFQEPDDRSLQLWALRAGGIPKSLGVLGADRVWRLTAGDNDVRSVPTLAISLEPKGGVSGETGPSGPVLFTGTLIQKTL